MRALITLSFFICVLANPIMGQNWPSPDRNTTPVKEWEEDNFAESLEKQQEKKIIILSPESTTPEQYEVQKTPQIIQEKELTVVNENAIVKFVPKDYSGFKIQIAQTEEGPLPETADIFFRHGNIIAAESNGGYSYFIGDFQEEQQAQQFLDRHISKLYPKARVSKFEDGRRLY